MRHSLQDLTGKTFGDLFVEHRAPDKVYPSGSKRIMWQCLCSCGLRCEVDGQDLRKGVRTDCGHSGCSLAEKQIRCILNKYNVEFDPEHTFDDLVSSEGHNLRFDFAIYVDNALKCLIEYQGIQHYWDYQFGYIQRMITDPMKKEYCLKNNIPLYEIKYDEDIEKKLLEILHVNSVPMSM